MITPISYWMSFLKKIKLPYFVVGAARSVPIMDNVFEKNYFLGAIFATEVSMSRDDAIEPFLLNVNQLFWGCFETE